MVIKLAVNDRRLTDRHRLNNHALLKENNLISKYSVRDFIEYIADVKKEKINNEWVEEPIVSEQKKLLGKLNIHFT